MYPSNLQTAQHLSSLESDRWERVRVCWRETQTMKTGAIRQTKKKRAESKRRTAAQRRLQRSAWEWWWSCTVMRWGSHVNIFSLILYSILIAKARQQHMQKWCGSGTISVSHTTQTEPLSDTVLSCDWLCVCVLPQCLKSSNVPE